VGLLDGKKAVIFGVANNKSIAYGIAKKLKSEGVEIGMTYAGEALKKRVDPIADELDSAFCVQCDVTSDDSIKNCFKVVEEKFGKFDYLIHSVAFAPAEDLKGTAINISRKGFHTALDISAYSLIGLVRQAEPLLNDEGSVIAMTYLGSVRYVIKYDLMGIAKAALESAVRYLAVDLGTRGIKVNAISAGPIKTLAARGVSDFSQLLNYVTEKSPLKRNVTQEDVAGTALYLCSNLSNGVSGQVIYVDSGFNIISINK
jgi:enoyl-[acyl-carrier protein] reductase I